MDKITYLFGAGASIKALPIVDEFTNHLEEFIKKLESPDLKLEGNKSYKNSNMTKRQAQEKIIELLKWLVTEGGKHASIDTFAKKLFLRGEYDALTDLKLALSVFFTYQQAINRPNPRYDTFFASIIEDLSNLPKNISILSWNYDHQFEIAFSEFSKEKDVFKNQDLLKVRTVFDHHYNYNYNGFGIYKINGCAELFSPREKKTVGTFYGPTLGRQFDLTLIDEVTKKFEAAYNSDELRVGLSFAWESPIEGESFFQKVWDAIRDTTVLVVIGYSFPFFNRKTDRLIISNIDKAKLKRVYIQAPDADNVIERFKAVTGDTNSF